MGLFEFFALAVQAVFRESSLTEVVLFATVMLFVVAAAYTARRSGVFFLALDGVLVVSACFSYLFAQLITHAVGKVGLASMLGGVLGGVAAGLVFTALTGWLIVEAGTNDIVVGIVANVAARQFSVLLVGMAQRNLAGVAGTLLPALHLGSLEKIPVLGAMLGNANVMSWLAILAPFGVFFLLNRTNMGLVLRAAQENPSALVGAGVSLPHTRMLGLLLAGGFAGLAGVACAMGALPARVQTTVPQGFGYLALVLVVAAGGRLAKSCLFALVFSVLGALPAMLDQLPVPTQLLRGVIYLAALVLLLLHAYRSHHRIQRREKAQRKKRAERKQHDKEPHTQKRVKPARRKKQEGRGGPVETESEA